jgi:hypothetical protein
MRCRLSSVSVDSSFCSGHARLPEHQPDPAAAIDSLTSGLKEFDSAIPINDFLSRLLLLLAQDLISPRKAAVLAYITNQLLHTLTAIDRELDPKNQKVQIIFDVPGPDSPPRDPQPDSQPQADGDLAHPGVRT